MAGLYIHIPFCRSKCAYCDFFSAPQKNVEITEHYVDALIAESHLRNNEINEGYSTIYIGGGTPSILSINQLERLTEGISRNLRLDNISEFTIEANPEDINRENLDAWTRLGINRISIGIQSFNEELINLVDRKHSASDCIKALELLSQAGINFNADLIYGLPEQSLQKFQENIETLVRFHPDHISAYLLSYEPGTKLYSRLITGKVKETDDEVISEMYQTLCMRLKSYGYEHYEIANFALPGKKSQHNASYWEFSPYLGLGTGAHSFDGTLRRYNPSNIKAYINHLLNEKTFYSEEYPGNYDRFNEIILTGLRTSAGLDINKALMLLKSDLDRQNVLNQIKKLTARGELNCHKDRKLYIPENRWLVSDNIIRELLIIE